MTMNTAQLAIYNSLLRYFDNEMAEIYDFRHFRMIRYYLT
ncbi:hypothetical protein Sbal117_2861 [Shewanella baltica OS117]|nr:hypothetical protein Sbal117_2861 [Shewanella baltica OS117]